MLSMAKILTNTMNKRDITGVLKSLGLWLCGFKSRPGHHGNKSK